jgi:hypothetical protein
MITQPLAPEVMQVAVDPEFAALQTAEGLLHPRQLTMLDRAVHDPASLGFEGTPEEMDRLRVAAVYIQEEHSAELLRRTNPDPLGATVRLSQYQRTPDADTLTRRTEDRLLIDRDAFHVLRDARIRAQKEGRGDNFDPIRTAESIAVNGVGTLSPASQPALAMRRILGDYEDSLFLPLVGRLQRRMADVPAEHAQQEIADGLLDTARILALIPEEERHLLHMAELTAAQRAFRRARTTEMTAAALAEGMDLPPDNAALALHELAMMGAVRRTPAGDRVVATEMLNAEPRSLRRTFRAIGAGILDLARQLRDDYRSAA